MCHKEVGETKLFLQTEEVRTLAVGRIVRKDRKIKKELEEERKSKQRAKMMSDEESMVRS